MQSLDTTDVSVRGSPASLPAQQLSLHVVMSPGGARGAACLPLALQMPLLIGRDVQEGDLNLMDSRVSRLHARADFDPSLRSYRLRDAQSRNGTFVNGQRIESAVLTHGDVVRVGDTLLVYREEDGMAQVSERLQRFAQTALTVLIRGETGTGKEVFARRLHKESGRRGGFFAVNCAGLPRDLIAAELFGHTRGAFSGAVQARRGLISSASGGTLLLDEVGDCPPDVQTALLRVLQERAIRPVGAEHEQPVDVRFVAATHRPLEELVASGVFRADLYARLSQVKVTLPPLRERKEELLELAQNFCETAGGRFESSVDAAEALLAWNWPFNVRELETLIKTFVVAQGPTGVLDLEYLRTHHKEVARCLQARPEPLQGLIDPAELDAQGLVAEPKRLRALLAEHRGNVSEVARALGKPRSQIYRWMRALGTRPGKFRTQS